MAHVLQQTVLHNSRGDSVRLLNFGARIASICIETETGPRELVLGYSRPEDYLSDPYFMGASIGRFANRIDGARFAIDGEAYHLKANEGHNQLHGGPVGFDQRFWTTRESASPAFASFTLRSNDGDQGYPGNLVARIDYLWTDSRQLKIRYLATTDQKTHVSMTGHPYFNLDGNSDSILGHTVRIAGDRITETDDQAIPTGVLHDVEGTPLDLRREGIVGDILRAFSTTAGTDQGVDCNFELSGNGVAAELWSSFRDLKLSITTTCPGMQFYTGQFLGSPFMPFQGLCLEPQYFPDSPNRPNFPSTLLCPNKRYEEITTYEFEECS